MNNKFWNVIITAVIGAFAFTACNDDDDILPIEQELAGNFIGSYEGSISFLTTEEFTNEQNDPIMVDVIKTISTGNGLNFAITPSQGNQLNLAIKGLSHQGDVWDFTLENIQVGYYANSYTLSGEQTLTLDHFGECHVTITGSGNATAVAATVYINPMNMDQKYTGFQFSLVGTKARGDESNAVAITAFEFKTSVSNNKKAELSTGVLDEASKTISFTCKAGSDLRKLKPTVTVTPQETATVYPATDTEQDFSSGRLIYTAVAEDGTKVFYTVIITPRTE